MTLPHPGQGDAPRPRTWAFLLAACLLATLSTSVRLAHHNQWRSQPLAYFSGTRPMLTSLDGYKWLRYAEQGVGLEAPGSVQVDPLMNYPDGLPSDGGGRALPFILEAAASLAGVPPITVALFLPPVLSGAFLLPLVGYFSVLGLGWAGLLGGFLAAFGSMYFQRTGLGSLDDDTLNLFFPILASLLILLASRAASTRRMLLWSAAAGASLLLFDWWYAHPAFTLGYSAVLAASLAWQRVAPRVLLACTGTFILAANPWRWAVGFHNLVDLLWHYVAAPATNAAGFPSVLQAVTEAQHAPATATLAHALEPFPVAALGLLGMAFLAARQPGSLLPFTPVVLLGLLSFQSSVRFSMFLGPCVGVGLGCLLSEAAHRVVSRVGAPDRVARAVAALTCCVAGAVLFPATRVAQVSLPPVNAFTYAAMERLQALPDTAAILTWWDNGLALEEASGRATFHDGMCQNTPKTYLIAHALMSHTPKDLHATASHLDVHGMDGVTRLLARGWDPERITREVAAFTGGPRNPDVYLFLSLDMVHMSYAISLLGTWDFASQQGQGTAIESVACNTPLAAHFSCGGHAVDLEQGLVDGDAPLARVVTAARETEALVREHRPKGPTLVLQTEAGVVTAIHYMEEDMYRSNLVQMLLLGRYDAALFEPSLDLMPAARLYRLKQL